MVGANEKCPCDSGLKYKKCCAIKDRLKRMDELSEIERIYRTGNEPCETVLKIRKHLDAGYSAIDVSYIINISNRFGIINANKGEKTYIVFTRNAETEPIFTVLGSKPIEDTVIMYNRQFQSFNSQTELEEAVREIQKHSS
jgi:hypothetical protein